MLFKIYKSEEPFNEIMIGKCFIKNLTNTIMMSIVYPVPPESTFTYILYKNIKCVNTCALNNIFIFNHSFFWLCPCHFRDLNLVALLFRPTPQCLLSWLYPRCSPPWCLCLSVFLLCPPPYVYDLLLILSVLLCNDYFLVNILNVLFFCSYNL